jgi:uncharacterized membrane protein YqjE
MKMLLLIAVLLLVALSFWADYRWKRWIAERKRERDDEPEQRV